MTPFQRAVEVMAKAMLENECPVEWATCWPDLKRDYMDRASAALRALIAASTEIGWKLVPVVATEGMKDAARALIRHGTTVDDIYTAMLAAAPGLEDGV
jgi:hypothetical protein